MKAVRVHEFGGVDKLVYDDAPRPAPGRGELLVRVHAADVNPVDVAVRQGAMGRVVKVGLPVTLGQDLSGVVEEVGEGVTRFSKGDAVFAYKGLAAPGGYAQYAVVKEGEAAPKPASVPHADAVVSIIQPPSPARAQEHGVRATWFLVEPNADQLAQVGKLLEEGKLKAVVTHTFPLRDAATAHEQIQTRHTRGKIVLKVVDE